MKRLPKISIVVLGFAIAVALAGCSDEYFGVYLSHIDIIGTSYADEDPSGIRIIVHTRIRTNRLTRPSWTTYVTVWHNDIPVRDPARVVSMRRYTSDEFGHWFTGFEADRTYYFWVQASSRWNAQGHSSSVSQSGISGPHSASFSRRTR